MTRRLIIFAAVLTMFAGKGLPVKAQTITQIVAKSGGDFDRNPFDYDILLTAVETAELADTLDDPNADFTLFAPNDLGFILTARDLGYQGTSEAEAWEFLVGALTEIGDGEPIPLLEQILLYHVAPESLGLFEVVFSRRIATVQGENIRPRFFRLRDNEPGLKNPSLFFPLSVRANNGVIHTINRVLFPIELP